MINGNFESIEDISKIQELRKSIGWRERSVSQWKEIISKSNYIYYLWEDDNLIGMGRMVGDGAMYMIYDVIVREEYQKKGFGKKIMNALMDKIEVKDDYVRVGLFAFNDLELIKFYKSFGFKEDFGMSMIVKK